ncbi:MAG: MCP four helix bundle domain-containing protein [Cellulomonas sp.]|nr:MCP four helix bundle domain-containing protein [Cellulomonas sp.]
MAGFRVICLLMVGVGAVGISELGAAQASFEGMYRDSTPAISWLGTIDTAFNLVRGQGDREEHQRRVGGGLEGGGDRRYGAYDGRHAGGVLGGDRQRDQGDQLDRGDHRVDQRHAVDDRVGGRGADGDHEREKSQRHRGSAGGTVRAAQRGRNSG